jgi:hypothetical protein
VKQYRLPQAIKDAYRDRDLIRPQPRPYAEIVRDLEAVSAMPGAADPEVQELLARDRLRLLHYCADVSDEEIERVLQRHGTTVAAMSEFERDRMLQNVTWGRRDLGERYLVPLLADIEHRIKWLVAETQSVENALSVARGEAPAGGFERESAWDGDFGLGISRREGEPETDDLSRGIRYAFRLQQLDFPYNDVIAAWDALIDKTSTFGETNWIIEHRLQVTSDYERPTEDMDREIQRAMEVFEGQPITDWAHIISWACGHYPILAEQYLPPIIAELEEKLREQPDPDDQRELDSIKDDLERARSMADTR